MVWRGLWSWSRVRRIPSLMIICHYSSTRLRPWPRIEKTKFESWRIPSSAQSLNRCVWLVIFFQYLNGDLNKMQMCIPLYFESVLFKSEILHSFESKYLLVLAILSKNCIIFVFFERTQINLANSELHSFTTLLWSRISNHKCALFQYPLQWGSEYQTSSVFKCLKRGRMLNGPVFKCHLKTRLMDALLF